MESYTPELKKILRENGCEFVRPGKGDHEIWRNPANGKKTTVDGKIKVKHTANGVLKQLGLDKAF